MSRNAFYPCIITIFCWFGALVGESIFLTYGILALIHAGPFETQNVTLGVVFIVLAGVGIAGIAGAIAGGITGGIVGSPALCCDDSYI